MQFVKVTPGPSILVDLGEDGPISGPPGVGELPGIPRYPDCAESVGNAGPPVHEGAKDVEYQCFDRHTRQA